MKVAALIVSLFLALPQYAPAHAIAAGGPGTLLLATWNMEWLVSASSLAALRQRCRAPQRPRALPCDVPYSKARNAADFARLAHYARALDADVIALQEVEDARTAGKVLKGYAFCFTARHDLQNVGFAIRRGIPYRCGSDLSSLALRDSVRRGAELTLFPDSPQALHLLSVHLKSGCAHQALDSVASACATLRRQIPALRSWIAAQAAAGHRFAVLGDFNRDLRQELTAQGGMWSLLQDGESAGARLSDASAGESFSNCVLGQTFSGFIDYILLGPMLAAARVPGSFRHMGYAAADARRYVLSDHCPVAVRLQLE